MLAQSVMIVVFVLTEKIRLGALIGHGGRSLSLLDMVYSLRCHSDDIFRNKKVKRGKPRKLETQIMVGEL